ncbi:hypothetical protein H4217_001168 [Coemansia sp. RSA 1939]|nr:hypothetical protein H4217_001168 [Coemansia sp. RSA 1939]KAJ2607235.1 hypothetical protein EV177_005630 [Coemansia sp. RSA 1804]
MGTQNARLMREYRMLQKELPQGIICTPKHERLDSYEASIEGPPSTPYENGRFLLDISLSSQYPIEPPSLRFKSKIYHPNIDDHGNICLDILKSGKKGSWNPSWTLGKVLVSLTVLLSTPNPHDPLMPEIADQLLNDRAGFESAAREWTSKYATGFSDDPAEYMVTSQELAPKSQIIPSQQSATTSMPGDTNRSRESSDAKTDGPVAQESATATVAKRASSADGSSALSTVPVTKKKLGLSRKSTATGASSSSSPDPANPLPPLPGKPPPGVAGIRRLGLSRSRNVQKQQQQQQQQQQKHQSQSSPSPAGQLADDSSQAESIDVTSDESTSVMPKKTSSGDFEPQQPQQQHSKRQKKGSTTSSLSSILAGGHKKPKTKTAVSAKAGGERGNQKQKEKPSDPTKHHSTATDSAVSEESEEVLFIHEPVCSSSNTGDISSSLDYECLLLSPGKSGRSSCDPGVYEEPEALPTVDESPPPSSPLIDDCNSNVPDVEADYKNKAKAEESNGVLLPVKNNADVEQGIIPVAEHTPLKPPATPSSRREDKGKATADFSQPLQNSSSSSSSRSRSCSRKGIIDREGDGGDTDERKVLYESHFGPLDLGLPPIRVSAQRRLMRRRARPDEGA